MLPPLLLLIPLLLLSPSAHSYIYCNINGSAWSSPDPQSKSTASKVIFIYRHGERLPLYTSVDWDVLCKKCAFPSHQEIGTCQTSKCEVGDLTERGYAQLTELGTIVSQRYTNLTSSYIIHTSSGISRSIASMHAFSMGLIPAVGTSNMEWTVRQGKGDPLYASASKKLNKEISTSADYPKECNSVKLKDGDMAQSKLCIKYNGQAEQIKIKDPSEAKAVFCREKYWETRSKILEQNDISLSRRGKGLIEALYLIMQRKESSLFFFYSAHDQSISLILNLLQCNLHSIPPFAAWLSIEIEEKETKAFYNGKEINCKSTTDLENRIRSILSITPSPE